MRACFHAACRLCVVFFLGHSAWALADSDTFPFASVPDKPARVQTALPLADPQAAGQEPERVELGPPVARVKTVDLTRPIDDIWERIRRGFMMPDLDSELVMEHQLFYLNRPSFLKQVFERGGRYLYHIVDELEARSLPTELALLPFIESAYNPLALSPARASGLWQFMPRTGQNFNLVQNKWVDQRRDITASTTAALDYLEVIYDMQGDWHLALASYNWGEGAVGRALQRNRDEGLPAEYSHLRLPNETRHYVPKLQALKNIIAHPEMFGIALPFLPNAPYFAHVEIPSGLDLASLAKMADVSLEELIALNPSFNSAVILERGHRLAVPIDKLATLRAQLAQKPKKAGQWQTYQLKRGEKIETVAARLKIPAQQLRQINHIGPKMRIQPGQTLLIPSGGDHQGTAEAARLIGSRRFPEERPSGGLGLR